MKEWNRNGHSGMEWEWECIPKIAGMGPCLIRKIIEVMGKAKVRCESRELLDLKYSRTYDTLQFAHREQPDIDSVTKGELSSFGPESEASKVERTWKNLHSEAKLSNPKKVLLDLHKTLSDRRDLCLMCGLYLSKDLEHLRAPHFAFNHIVRKFAFGSNRWTKEETQTLIDNLTESDEVLLRKIPSKSLEQIKAKIKRFRMDQKAEIKNQPFTLEEDLQIALFVLREREKLPESVEEFRQITKGVSWIKLSESMKRSSPSLSKRFSCYIKPFIEAHYLDVNLKEEIVRFNRYLVQFKIPSRDKIEWNLFSLSKTFYYRNVNLDHEDRNRKDEPLWTVVMDRNERGVSVCAILPEDHGKAILKALS